MGKDGRAAIGLILLGACSFEPSGAALAPGSLPDGAAPTSDARPCPADVHPVISTVGLSGGPDDESVITVIVGETVELTAAGSCTRRGPVAYRWQFEDDALAATIRPVATAETITVYPEAPGDYLATLTVSDGVDDNQQAAVVTIRAVGWRELTTSLDIRDIALGKQRVWLASSSGGYALPTGDLDAEPTPINDLAEGDEVPNDLSTVHYDGVRYLWFGHKPSDDFVYRVDLDPATPVAAAVSFAVDGGLPADEVRDIQPGPAGGVEIGTKSGVARAPDNATFEEPILLQDIHTLGRGPSGGWAGGQKLWRLGDGAEFEPLGSGDNKIRALLDRGGLVWVGTDNKGLAWFDSQDETTISVFSTADGLPSNKVRDIVTAPDGDVWLAFDGGVVRYKSDYQTWVIMAGPSGLGGNLDVRAVLAYGNGTGKRILAGTNGKLLLLAVE